MQPLSETDILLMLGLLQAAPGGKPLLGSVKTLAGLAPDDFNHILAWLQIAKHNGHLRGIGFKHNQNECDAKANKGFVDQNIKDSRSANEPRLCFKQREVWPLWGILYTVIMDYQKLLLCKKIKNKKSYVSISSFRSI